MGDKLLNIKGDEFVTDDGVISGCLMDLIWRRIIGLVGENWAGKTTSALGIMGLVLVLCKDKREGL